MTIAVRAATRADAALMAKLTRAAWAGKVAPDSSGHGESEARVARQLAAGGGFILQHGQTPIGSVRWAPLEDDAKVWEMMRMGILPGFRRRNLSERLMGAVISLASERTVRELRLAVRTDQPRLLEFYATYGFVIAPGLTYSHAAPGQPAPAVMRRDLTVRS